VGCGSSTGGGAALSARGSGFPPFREKTLNGFSTLLSRPSPRNLFGDDDFPPLFFSIEVPCTNPFLLRKRTAIFSRFATFLTKFRNQFLNRFLDSTLRLRVVWCKFTALFLNRSLHWNFTRLWHTLYDVSPSLCA